MSSFKAMGISSAFDTLSSWSRELFFTSLGWDKYRRLSTVHPYFRHIFYDEVPAVRSSKLKWHLLLKKKKANTRLLELEGRLE